MFVSSPGSMSPKYQKLSPSVVVGTDDKMGVRIELVGSRRIRDLLHADGDLHGWYLLGLQSRDVN